MNSPRKGYFISSSFQDTSVLNKYHGKWYSEDSWRDIIHKNFEIKLALAFTGKDLNTAISKYKHFKIVIQELSYTNQCCCCFRSTGHMPCPNYEAVEFQPRTVDNSAP